MDNVTMAELCERCAEACLLATMDACWDADPRHAVHYRLIGDCGALCDLTAKLLRANSPAHPAVRTACVDVCAACALACAELGLDACAAACRACANQCAQFPVARSVASVSH